MNELPLIESAGEINGDWLRRALVAGGRSEFPEIPTLEVESLSDVATNALGSLFRCRAFDRDGAPLHPASVIVKMPTGNALAFRMAKWLALHRREYVYYRDIAAHSHLRAPALHYGDFDTRSHRFVLVLEDLGDMEAIPQTEGVGVDRARLAIRGIARLHGRFWEAPDDPALTACGAFLNTREARIMQTIYLLTLPVALERFGDLFPAAIRHSAEAFGYGIATHFARLAEGPRTVVHGDYRADNVLFGTGAQSGLAVIDWQGCGLGCGMYDVAFFLATSVTTDDRRRIERDLLDEYHEIACRLGATEYTREACWRSYRQNVLGCLMPMVIGSGAIDMSDETVMSQTRVLLGRTLAVIGDLDAWEFLPSPDRAFSSDRTFAILSRCGFKAYTSVLALLKRLRG